MKKSLLLVPLLLQLPSAAEVIVSYDAGVAATAGTTGAADPATQGWTFSGGGNSFASGLDSTIGGWRITDGTGTASAFYQQTISPADATKVAGGEFTTTWTVAVNADAVRDDGVPNGVDDYYTAPNTGRQGNNAMWIELATGLRYILTVNIDANNDIQVNDGTNVFQITTANNQLSEELGTGAPLANYITFTLSYAAGAATLTDSLGGNHGTVATSGTGSQNRLVWGATSSGGQGSTTWNAITLTVPDPVPGDQLTWTGATDGTWDAVIANWALADSSPTAFTDGDDVTFDDTASTGSVTVSGTQEPGSILFSNDALAYTLGGDPLSGLATLTKEGPGSLTITSNLNNLGGTTLTAGSITAGDGATAGEVSQGPVSVAAGTTLTISRSDLLDYKATPKLVDVSGDGDLVLDGGGILFTYPGGGLGFNSAGTWAGFSGDITLVNGSELQTIRNGATGRGSGSLILGDGSSSGSLSQIEGNWTWTNPIVATGADNFIVNRSAGADRSLKLQGPVSGTGNLTFSDATGAMGDLNLGFVITNDVTLGGTLTIDLATPVRVGGVPGEVDVSGTGLDADSSGSLGSTAVVNNGTLTFSRTDAHTVASAISGTGSVRIGIPSTATRGDTSTQVVTIDDATKTYSGFTDVESGTLVITGSLLSSIVDVNPEGTLGGTGVIGQSTLVSGALAPGTSVGTLTFNDELILAADSTYRWEVSDFTGSAGTGYDTLTANFLDCEGTAANPITIVVEPDSVTNFSEAAATFTLATAANVITTIDLAGFVVDDTAFSAATGSAGSWAVQLSGDLLSLELVYTPGSPNSFANWIDGFFPGETDPAIIGFGADPDGDGIGNGVENFLGTAPDEFNAGLTVGASTASSVTATHSQSNNPANDIAGDYEWSSDLEEWNSSGATDSNGVTATINAVVTDDQDAPANDTVEVTATVTGGPAGRIFLRARAFLAVP